MNIKTASDILYGNAVEKTTLTFTPTLEVIEPPQNMSIEGILARLTAALDEQARQIEVIKSLL
jgi:hypothetical protein